MKTLTLIVGLVALRANAPFGADGFLMGASMKKIRTQLLATVAMVALSGSAYAADMGVPMKAPAPVPIPYAGWQGWYLGGSIGTARLNMTANQTVGPAFGPCSRDSGAELDLTLFSCSTGFTAGVQAGYDWQSEDFVYGVVADWTWTNQWRDQHSVLRGESRLAG